MFLQERYRRQPWRRPSPAPDAARDPDTTHEQPEDPGEEEPNAWDEADELAAMPSDEFLRGLRADVDAVAAGQLPSGIAAQRPRPKDRPWGRLGVASKS